MQSRGWSMSPGRKCANPGCTTRAIYGIEGTRTHKFCAQHARQGMINVNRKKCANQGCTTQPSYGVKDSKTPELCAQHARQGMVDVVNKRCANQGCTKRPSYGVEGGKTPELCAQHAKQGMVNVVSKRCANQACNKVPSYGVEGSKTPELCAQHAKQGMVYVKSKTHANQGCTKRHPSYGVELGGVESRCGRPPVKNTESWVGVVSVMRKDRVGYCVVKTTSPRVASDGNSRKRTHRDANLMAPDSVQSDSTRTRNFAQGSSTSPVPTATPKGTISVLDDDGLAVKLTASIAEAAASGGAIAPMFTLESGVTVKVEDT